MELAVPNNFQRVGAVEHAAGRDVPRSVSPGLAVGWWQCPDAHGLLSPSSADVLSNILKPAKL